MLKRNEQEIQRNLRSPRAAAAAGIAYSVLMTTSMILLSALVTSNEFSREWLQNEAATGRRALLLVPYAGIAFLWFTAVIRDRMGEHEDRFFSTVFMGSGIIVVLLTFIWAATLGAILTTYAVSGQGSIDNDVFYYGAAFVNEVVTTYTLRMAGVYMMSIGSLWSKTNLMPRWLVLFTVVLAVVFLVLAGQVRYARFLFPAWVFVVSAYVLIANPRRASKDIDT